MTFEQAVSTTLSLELYGDGLCNTVRADYNLPVGQFQFTSSSFLIIIISGVSVLAESVAKLNCR